MLHGIGVLLIAAWFAAFSVRMAEGAERLELHLREAASVLSNEVLLKDIADVKSTSCRQVDAAAALRLGPAPEFGAVKTWNRHQIGQLLKSSGFSQEVRFSGALAVQVRLRGRPVSDEEIEPLIRSHLTKTTCWKQSEIQIRAIDNLEGIEAPVGGAMMRISSDSAVKGTRRLLVPVEIVQKGKILRCFWAAATIEIDAEVATASRRIPRGAVLGEDDIEVKRMEITDLRGSYVRKREDALGKAARRTFSAGDVITQESLAKPFLVKKGETVQLRLQRNGIMLRSPVRAEQNGTMGQIIKVRNLDFSTVLKAQVTGKAEVELQ